MIDAIRAEDKHFVSVKQIPPLALHPIEVCAVSGQQLTRFCPLKKTTWYIPGVSPIEKCQIHRPVYIESKTGLRACKKRNLKAEEKVYEFWPSNLLNVFRNAGVPRRTPPPYHPDCKIAQITSQGQVPQITSPRTKLSYQLQQGKEQEKIPFMVITDADVEYVYWFLNESYIGKAKRGTPFFWQPKPGNYIVRVIDDMGRGSRRRLKVELIN